MGRQQSHAVALNIVTSRKPILREANVTVVGVALQ
jgi:hypothetical protein